MTNADLRAPFSAEARPELTGGRRIGALVSHGFTGSPVSMRPWADDLARRGYGVELPLLPGHGTTWQEMNSTTWADWYAAVTRAFEKLRAANDVVVAAGLSMGGSLLLRLAADHPGSIAGLAVVNPMITTRRKDVLALPVLKWVVPSFPGIINDIKKPGADEGGYDRTPLKAAHSMFRSTKALGGDLPRITAPLLIFRSADDHLVDDSSVPVITARVSSRDVTVRTLADSYHVATLDNDAPTIFEESGEFFTRVTT
ncbi:MAG: alpha/beta hydrolase [Nocardioides sp.]